MNELVLGLMACFGLVLGGAVAMILVHRRHLRAWRSQQRWVVAGRRLAEPGRQSLAIPLPGRWMAIHSSNTPLVQRALGVPEAPVPWSEALARAGEDRLFVSAPVSGWTLVVGDRLPDPAQDVDDLYRFLVAASREAGEVQYFSMDRVLGFHAWARLREGRVLRGYAWAGGTEWNEGRPTLDERLLKLRCRAYGDEAPPAVLGEPTPELENCERVPLLARRWGIDLAAGTEILLQAEAVQPDEGGDR